MVESKNVTWDVVEVESAELVRGCEEGLYEKLDYAKIGDKKDFIPKAVSDCGVGTFIWDLGTGESDWDDRLLALFGYDRRVHGFADIGAFESRVHPEDLGRVIGRSGRTAKALRQVMNGVGGKGIRVDVVDVDRR